MKTGTITQFKISYEEMELENPINDIVRGPKVISEIFKKIESNEKPKVVAVYLGRDLRIKNFQVLTVGGMYLKFFSPVELYRTSVLVDADAVIFAVNHTSGDAHPLPKDIVMIEKLERGLSSIQTTFLDYIIIGKDSTWSMRDKYDSSMFLESQLWELPQ